MKYLIGSASVFAVFASSAFAGGLDRSGQNIGMIFEKGDYAELSFGAVSPNVSGTAIPALGGFSSGNMAGTYLQFGGAIKHSYDNGLDVALIFDQPFGADVDYPAATGYYAGGAIAELNTNAITGVVKYTTANDISVYGGVRYQTLEALADVPFIPTIGYDAVGESDGGFGYLVGVAYERPEIALRVALTYNSKITHELATTENSVLGAGNTSTLEIVTPQSINLDVQSGIAKDTLIFGSIRWAQWSEFDISPDDYVAITGVPLVSYEDDRISYSLGIGRRFNENYSGAFTLGYEAQAGGISSNLGPTDGHFTVGLGGSYTKDNVKISAGVRYVMIGDAQTQIGAAIPAADFENNHAWGFGIKIGYSF